MPEQISQTCVLGSLPNAVEQPQKILVLVASSVWTSSPITISHSIVLASLFRFRRLLVEVGHRLICFRRREDFRFAERLADKLHADGKPLAVNPAGNRHARH